MTVCLAYSHRSHPSRQRMAAAAFAMAGALLLFSAPAQAQSHHASQGGYSVRSTLIESTSLPAASLRQQGIKAAPNQSLLNVVILKDGAGPTSHAVPAKVTATMVDLLGQTHSIDLREVKADDRVSYLGLVQHEPHEVVAIRIKAMPVGGAQPLTLNYREQTQR